MKHWFGLRHSCALATLLFATVVTLTAAPAWAVRQRTFVAPDPLGQDANAAVDCTLAQPCRTFNVAIPHTTPGGELIILGTAGYGPMTIDRSIKIVGPSGVYGGISVQGGGGSTTGVLINAGNTDVITLRGLDIVGVPGAPPLPLMGIDIQNAGTVHVEKTSINNFTQDTSACIHASSAKPIQIFVNDSFLRECSSGIAIHGTGPDDASRIGLVVDNTHIEHGVNTGPSGTAAVVLDDAVNASLRNSVLAFAGYGVAAGNANAAVNLRVTVIGSQIARMGTAAIVTDPAPGGTLHVNVSNSTINSNTNALLHGRGRATFTSNVIHNNDNVFVDCGSGTVQSFGYDVGNGSNSVYNFSNTVLPAGCIAFIAAPTIFKGL